MLERILEVDNFRRFWARHPALFMGTSFLIGSFLSLARPSLSVWDLVLVPVFLVLFSWKRIVPALVLACVAFWSTSVRVQQPLEQGAGVATGYILDRTQVCFHGRELWKELFFVESLTARDGRLLAKGVALPIVLSEPLPGGVRYRVHASLRCDDKIRFRIFSGKQGVSSAGSVPSFVEPRVSIRRTLERIFSTLFADPDLRQMAAALTFGLPRDGMLQQAMHRAGVEHVLAVSGFHFGIVAALTAFLARGLAPRLRASTALVLLTLYFLVIGPLPSVLRAWAAAVTVLVGVLIDRRTSGLNCLGVGLIAAVVYDPCSVMQIGFQCSYLATAAILLFSRPMHRLLQRCFPKRSVEDIVQFSWTDQALLGVVRSSLPALAILIPVSGLLLPYQAAFLAEFSLLGVVYNLLIPVLFSLAMPPILLAVIMSPIPLIPSLCASIASVPLRIGLSLVQSVPEVHAACIQGGCIAPPLGRLIIALTLLAGILLHMQSEEPFGDEWKACL